MEVATEAHWKGVLEVKERSPASFSSGTEMGGNVGISRGI